MYCFQLKYLRRSRVEHCYSLLLRHHLYFVQYCLVMLWDFLYLNNCFLPLLELLVTALPICELHRYNLVALKNFDLFGLAVIHEGLPDFVISAVLLFGIVVISWHERSTDTTTLTGP